MTVKEYLDKKPKKKPKTLLRLARPLPQTKEAADKEQRKAFYKAFIEKDRAGMAEISQEVAKEYKARARTSPSTLTVATWYRSASPTASSRSGRS